MSEPEFKALSEQLDRIEAATTLAAKDVIRIEEASLFTGFSVGHLYNLTSKRQIPHYKQGSALFFKKAELEAWLTETRIASERELEMAATTHVATRRFKK